MKKSILVFLLALLLLPCIALADTTGYDSLAQRGGEKQQAFYTRLLEELTAFGQGDQTAPKDLVIFSCTSKESGLTSDEMGEAAVMVIVDHPELYFTSLEQITQYSHSMEIKVLPECAAAADRRTLEAEIAQAEAALLEQIRQTGAASAYDVTKATHDAIIRWTDYDLEAPMQHTIAGLLSGRKAVCDGYAKTLKYLLEKQGVHSLVVFGYAGEDHAWNLIQMEDDSWITADLTWDDFGGVAYDFFDMKASVFAMSHQASTPEDTGVKYYFDLPDMGVPAKAKAVKGKGVWKADCETITADTPYDQVMARMIEACVQAIENGKGGFSVPVNSKASKYVSNLMNTTIDFNGEKLYFFDVHMQEDVRAAGIFAGLTSKGKYSSGRMTFTFNTWEKGTRAPTVYAYADGALMGVYHSIAQAYVACQERTVQTLRLELTATDIYALPVLSSAPEGVEVLYRGDYAYVNLIPLGPIKLKGDMELCNISVKTPPAILLDMDLGNHHLTLGDRIEMGFSNINTVFGDADFSNRSRIYGGEGSALINDVGTGMDTIRDVYASVDVESIILREGDLNLRGTDNRVHAKVLRVEETGGYPRLSPGVNEAIDSVIVEIDTYENTGAYLNMSLAEGQKIIIHDIVNTAEGDNIGGIRMHLAKYGAIQKDGLDGVPEVTIGGDTDIYTHYSFQFTVPGNQNDVKITDCMPAGTVLINAPGHVGQIDTYYAICSNDGSTQVSSGSLPIDKDENGAYVITEYEPSAGQ